MSRMREYSHYNVVCFMIFLLLFLYLFSLVTIVCVLGLYIIWSFIVFVLCTIIENEVSVTREHLFDNSTPFINITIFTRHIFIQTDMY